MNGENMKIEKLCSELIIKHEDNDEMFKEFYSSNHNMYDDDIDNKIEIIDKERIKIEQELHSELMIKDEEDEDYNEVLEVTNSDHTGERIFTYNVCDKKFTRKNNLDRHIRIHTGEKPFTCNVCDKKFTQKNNLDSHIRIHNEKKRFTSPINKKAAASQKNTVQDMCS
ncbi:zinc finger protein 568-like [Chrysoperla carnea]|uniref:zinc finger protein 568-like n=1 Tax=Chrysoperla carnea TaxID=189513 RepID=UPI001D094FB5|nr:zinc finger protein 568-like [Chrysoperla carnea]